MKQTILLADLLLMLAHCAPRVVVDSAQVDFSKYRTGDWIDSGVTAGQNSLYYNLMATQNVEDIINKALTDRDLRQVGRRLDLLVGHHFFMEEKTRTVIYSGTVSAYGSC